MIKKLKKEQLLIGAMVGILLLVIAIPVPGETGDSLETSEYKMEEVSGEDAMETQLEQILQKISGVVTVKVLITYEDRGRIIVEKDSSVSEELVQEADSNGGTRTTTTTRREEETVYHASDSPYVIRELLPTIKGVLVVAQGAGNESIKTKIRETIEALFGLETHKISIMKMEVSM